MGNAAAKETQDNTPLGTGTLGTTMSISPTLVTKEDKNIFKGKNKTWIIEESGATYFTFISKGFIRSHSIVNDADGNYVATIIKHKTGMTSSKNYICKNKPTYNGQTKLENDILKKTNIDEGTELYPFAVVDTKNSLSTAQSTYKVITGPPSGGGGEKEEVEVGVNDFTYKVVYTGEKLSAMNFYAMFKEGDTVIAKASMRGMTVYPTLETSSGVDVLAIVCIGNTLVGDGSSAGAMAGAGVV